MQNMQLFTDELGKTVSVQPKSIRVTIIKLETYVSEYLFMRRCGIRITKHRLLQPFVEQ